MNKKKLLLILLLLLALPLSLVSAQDMMDPPPGFDSWDAVVAAADGATVNWYMWGGSDSINGFVDTIYGGPLAEEYNITLNRVPANTIDIVNQVLSEAEAGVTGDDGTVDLIWINGENFFTLKQADLLYGPWAENVPNSVYVNWDNPALNLDFGRPVEGMESPWSGAQFHFIYDSARMSADDLPRSYAELDEWISMNPGRFTYIAPGPGAFQGTRFVKQALFEISGGQAQWVGDFNQELYDEHAPALWDMLNSWEENLWRGGETYPANIGELHELFANGEIDFTLTQRITGAAVDIESGLIPPSSRAFSFDDNMIGDFNYVAIPYNAPNKAAALVLADLILRPDRQALQVVPENGFGLAYGIDVSRVSDPDDVAALQAASESLGDAAADPARLAGALVSDIAAEYQVLIEADWEANVLQG
ncbi:MAG: ABC transporter substrate-binding protein [Chloroflexi bacterium]|nr:ABC transporter substrate-binding protein [Chloroflexota bacterium]MCY3583973.1 ABC transporter substrate-binding protein [Chloroflexota bacterium]MCY3717712.1 ABC transporter substrate-binding protein [Chloroflexota bacterium]MDE2649290.1 ABC transporter substrate-binding protein [Chloroflexota bacterium]MXV93449.1 ABC transporter substrate-binding protein [Chloroflexota bacterium]